jgi:hypothetical protein
VTEDALEGVVASLTKQLGMLAPDGRLAALDSLKRVELVVALEELLKIDLFEAQFRPADFITVATVVALVTRAGGAANAALANAARASAVIESAAVDDRAEQALADHVRALSEAELAAELALWSSVDLVPERSAIANELDDARGTLFSRLLAQHRIDADDGRPLARRSATACEVTFTQERMWASHRLGDTVRLGHAHAFPIRGELDVDAMRSSFATLAARHAAMRSRMVVDGARLVQSVEDGARVLDVVDLSALPADERTARARALFDATAQAHDLAVEPFRCQLVRLDEREHLLLLAAHHIVCDGVSYRAMWPDWSTLYAAATANTARRAQELVAHLGAIVAAIANVPDQPVAGLPRA